MIVVSIDRVGEILVEFNVFIWLIYLFCGVVIKFGLEYLELNRYKLVLNVFSIKEVGYVVYRKFCWRFDDVGWRVFNGCFVVSCVVFCFVVGIVVCCYLLVCFVGFVGGIVFGLVFLFWGYIGIFFLFIFNGDNYFNVWLEFGFDFRGYCIGDFCGGGSWFVIGVLVYFVVGLVIYDIDICYYGLWIIVINGFVFDLEFVCLYFGVGFFWCDWGDVGELCFIVFVCMGNIVGVCFWKVVG